MCVGRPRCRPFLLLLFLILLLLMVNSSGKSNAEGLYTIGLWGHALLLHLIILLSCRF